MALVVTTLVLAASLSGCSPKAGDSAIGGSGAVGDSGGQPALPAELQAAFTTLDEGGSKFIAAKDVALAVDAGLELVFVDARPPLDYEFGHIPQALNVPYYEADQHLDRLPKDRWLIVYCECPHAEAEMTADVLLANGFRLVKVIDEGLAGWRDLGRPTVGGPPAD